MRHERCCSSTNSSRCSWQAISSRIKVRRNRSFSSIKHRTEWAYNVEQVAALYFVRTLLIHAYLRLHALICLLNKRRTPNLWEIISRKMHIANQTTFNIRNKYMHTVSKFDGLALANFKKNLLVYKLNTS